jgi:hypothetical protein
MLLGRISQNNGCLNARDGLPTNLPFLYLLQGLVPVCLEKEQLPSWELLASTKRNTCETRSRRMQRLGGMTFISTALKGDGPAEA